MTGRRRPGPHGEGVAGTFKPTTLSGARSSPGAHPDEEPHAGQLKTTEAYTLPVLEAHKSESKLEGGPHLSPGSRGGSFLPPRLPLAPPGLWLRHSSLCLRPPWLLPGELCP